MKSALLILFLIAMPVASAEDPEYLIVKTSDLRILVAELYRLRAIADKIGCP